jgi:F0F1-type ATP synthase assembly protein I
MAKPPDDDASYRELRSAGLMLAIPTLLIVAPLAGFFGGAWLDGRWHSGPWLAITGLLLGFIAAGRETWLIYQRSVAEDEAGRRNKESKRP